MAFRPEPRTIWTANSARADIISSATISSTPLVKGALLKPGAHVDLVGGFTPDMRESDDDAIARARIYVDTRAGATKEAGDIVQPLASGVLKPEAIVADLRELARGERKGRETASEITLFKSVGAALEDLAAGIAVYRDLTSSSTDADRRRQALLPDLLRRRSAVPKAASIARRAFLEAVA